MILFYCVWIIIFFILVYAVHFVVFALEEPVDVVAAAVAHGDAAIDSTCADVWREHYVVEFEEFGRYFWFEFIYVESCAIEMTTAEVADEGSFVDVSTTGCVDEHRALFHYRESFFVDNMVRIRSVRQVERYEIGSAQ